MILNPKFIYPEVEQVTLDSGFRYYVCPETAAKMASVTTILDSTADKSGLLEWRAWVGEVKANTIRDEASQLGSLMHTHVECFVEGIERPSARTPFRKQASDMADLIIEKGLPKVDEVWGVETRLYVPGLFAGTTDLCGIYDGKEAIMDHKSSKKLKNKSDIIDYRDQLSAYAIAHNERYGTNIETGVVFMACRTGEYKTFVFDADEMKEGKQSFINRLEHYYANAPEIVA